MEKEFKMQDGTTLIKTEEGIYFLRVGEAPPLSIDEQEGKQLEATSKDIKLQPVESSNLESIGYDQQTMTLRIRFKNGGLYDYADVPLPVHLNFISAESVGKYYAANIKKVYDSTKIEPGSADQA